MNIVLCQCGQRIDTDNDAYKTARGVDICEICMEQDEVDKDE